MPFKDAKNANFATRFDTKITSILTRYDTFFMVKKPFSHSINSLTVFELFFLSLFKLYIRKNKLEEERKRAEEIHRNFEKIVEYFKQQAKSK